MSSAITLKPSELRTMAREFMRAKLPLLIQGAPGIGKTEIIKAAVQDAGAELLLTHPAVSDPTDVKGFPWVVDGKATFLPFGELLAALSFVGNLLVWFMDDIGQASPAVQASLMQLLHGGRVNGHVLPSNVVFIGATNRRTDRCGVSGILEAVKSRYGAIVELQADVDEWSAWAIDHDVPPQTIAFNRMRPDLLSKFEPSADLTNSPSPRTWEHVAKIETMDLPENIRNVAIAGAIGEGTATEYIAFKRIYATLPSVDQIIIDPMGTPYPSEPATLYALSSALAYKATDVNFGNVIKFAERLDKDGHGEFAVLAIRDAVRRTPKLQHTNAYVRLITGKTFYSVLVGRNAAA